MLADEQRTTNNQPQLIIFVGLQGSGKTRHYHDNFAATHVHVSKDVMGNVRNRDLRQREQIHKALSEGRSVVVDNTNPTPTVRAPLIELGHALGARVIAYYFEIPVKSAVERNRLRQGRERVPDVAIYVTSKKIVPPTVEEGFDEVRVVPTAEAL